MSTTQNTTEERHLSRERLHKISAAYGDTNKAVVARVLAVTDAIADGFTVKQIAADLADAHRADDNVNAVSAVHLGYAAAAGDVASILGISIATWCRTAPDEVAATVRAVKRGGKKKTLDAIRDAIRPLGDDGSMTDRRELASTAVEGIRAEVKAANKRAARPADTGTEPEATREDGAPVRMTDADALAAIRAVTAHLVNGGTYTADLASAVADLTAAMSSARKRGADAARKTAQAA